MPPLRARTAAVVRALLACASLASIPSCGGASHPPMAVDRSDAGGGDAQAPGDAADAIDAIDVIDAIDDAGPNPIAWTHLANVDRASLPWIGLYRGAAFGLGLAGAYSVRLSDGAVTPVTLVGSPGAESHDEGAFCIDHDVAYQLGGGGNGIFGDWNVTQYDAIDLAASAWKAPSAAPAIRHHDAAVSVGTGCAMIGGDASQHGDVGTTTVFVSDATAGSWTSYAPLPIALTSTAAAFDGKRLTVAGGMCHGAACPLSSGTTDYVSAQTLSLDLTDTATGWARGPDLPYPVHQASAVWHAGRYYVAGGYENDQPPYTSHRAVVSWAPGDASARVEGRLPGGATTCVLLSDGTRIYAAVAGASSTGSLALDLYAWAP